MSSFAITQNNCARVLLGKISVNKDAIKEIQHRVRIELPSVILDPHHTQKKRGMENRNIYYSYCFMITVIVGEYNQ